ncbi:MAG TPA: hypothetical protein VNY51_01225 [Candidatus Dormibacteraeota bacterium]|nr:hypothetical protein [Candidatus Dormibacteraeota bacterium]
MLAQAGYRRALWRAVLAMAMLFASLKSVRAQSGENERTFPQSKAAVEKILKEMQPASSGRLPVLAGFARSGDRPLERYQRGYYESKFQVSAAPSGGSLVRVTVQVTAWYADPTNAHSGYQVLPSNGRLEADLLDQLADQLAVQASPTSANSTAAAERTSPPSTNRPSKTGVSKTAEPNEPSISAPMPRLPEVKGGISASLDRSLADREKNRAQAGSKKPEEKGTGGPLQTEAENLEEILKNQAHPKNLVAVKKSGTPVVSGASLNAKTLFLASAHDEFEMLNFSRDWVHVRISGLSRGWIWRNNLEMPDSVPDADLPTNPAAVPVAAELFHVSRTETALFPGDWGPLRGKNVRIVSVENTDETGKDPSPQLRLEFAKSVLDQSYTEIAQKFQDLAGVVLIFDSADGGMIAATVPTLKQWKAGSLSDAALWHQCFFDPPETFTGSGVSASQ